MSWVQISQNTSTMPSIKIIHKILNTYCSCSTAKSCSTSAGRSDLRKSSFRSSFWASTHRERILRRICTKFAVLSYCVQVGDMEANANANEYYPISLQYMPTLQGLQFNSVCYKKMIVIDHTIITIGITTHLKYDSKMNIHQITLYWA